MRTILCLAILVGSFGAALAVETPPATSTALPSHVRTSHGAALLTVDDASETPFARPTMRFLVLPPTTGEARVRLLPSTDTGEVPDLEVTAGAPMVLRGLRLLPIQIAPPADGSGKTAALSAGPIEIDIRYEESSAGVAANPAPIVRGRGFFDAFRPWIPVENMAEIQSEGEGSYVIVTDPDFESAIAPLADWKRATGLDVIVMTTDETGFSAAAIKNEVSRLYHESERPPQYLLLVGDAPDQSFSGGVPAFDYHGIISDHSYSTIDGDDFLPDLTVGRLSARSVSDVQTMVAKILRHEQDPYTESGTDWFGRGLVVGADYGSSTPVAVSKWCKDELLEVGFSTVDEVYYPPWWSDHLHLIPTSINSGVSIVSYRGWAYGIHGWEPPHFTTTEIDGLTNGWMLPVVFSFVCQNLDFREPTCFGEAWLRAGSPTQPKGAVAFIGNSEPWSHTRFNDAAAIGAFTSIRNGDHRLSAIIQSFKFQWLVEFPTEIPYEGAEKESVEFYFHMYNLLGDPEMEIWTAPPMAIAVDHPTSVPSGSNFVMVSVRAAEGDEPVVGARIGVSRNNQPIGAAWTNESGIARVSCGIQGAGAPVVVTVTGKGVDPYIGSVDVTEGSAYLSLESFAVDDDMEGASRGNADGIPNPGERLELRPALRNQSGAAATGIGAMLDPSGAETFCTIITGSAEYPDLLGGASAEPVTPFVVELLPTVANGQVGSLRLEAISGGIYSESEIRMAARAADLRHESSELDSDLAPGTSANLGVRLRNDGAMASANVSAILRTISPEYLSVQDSTASFAMIQPGETGLSAEAFSVAARPEAAVGSVATMRLLLEGEDGQVSETSFSIQIGAVDHSAPLGPDAHGYYAYDNSDTDYPDAAPVFDYVNCSPVYGGSGTKLNLGNNKTVTVDLPFQFTYYGKPYGRIAVCDNGWISFDTSDYYDFYNWHMPNIYGNALQVSPFWDNLDPTRKRYGVVMGDGIYTWHDAENHRFFVEWSRLPNFNPLFDDLQTFQVILYDPEHHATPTGDGIIEFQYKQVVNNDYDRMYATVGIEDESEHVGLECTYSNTYPAASAPLSSGLAIRITTQPARFNPPSLSRFSASPMGSRILLTWEPKDERRIGGYRVYRSVDAGFERLTETLLDPSVRSYVDESASAESSCVYRIGSVDPFGRETILGPFPYAGIVPGRANLALDARTPNPFRGGLELTYSLPGRLPVELQIHDLGGRLVRTLVGGVVDAGSWTAVWDGRDDAGRDLPSGIYLCRLRAGSESRSLKLTLLR